MKLLTQLLALVAALAVFGPSHLRGTRQVESGNQDRREGSWRTAIIELDPNRKLLMQLLLLLKQRSVTDPEFKLFQREHRSQWTQLTSAVNNSTTTIPVDDGRMFRVDDVLQVPSTEELMLCTAISGNSLTCTRGVLGSTATAALDNAFILKLFTRKEENSRANSPITTDIETIANFTQIFEEVYGESRTNSQTRKRGPSDIAEDQRHALDSYKRQMEHAFTWGKKRLEVSGGDTFRYTGGFNEFVTSNRYDAEGGLGWGDMGYITAETSRYGDTKKIWLVGRDARQQMDNMGLDYLRIKQDDNILGMAVDGIRTSFGEFMLVTHHGLDQGHADKILIVDPMHISMAVLMGMKHNKNVQENDRDGKKHQFLGEAGLWLDTEEAHAVITGVSDILTG